jgi:CRP-like cAMP-binding protein
MPSESKPSESKSSESKSLEFKNRLLSALSTAACQSLVSASTHVNLPLRTVLYEADQTPSHAYFMTSGIASVVTAMADGGTAEVGLIGAEGVVGSLHLLGPAPVSTTCFIQLDGSALRIPFSQMQNAFRSSPEIRDRVLEFVQAQASSLGQLAGCHRLHEAEERLARWLLMAQDRVLSDSLYFTQEFLAMMLGARRTTVTVVAGGLQRKGLIQYRRGHVKILDRKGLEATACDCYKILERLNTNLYTHPYLHPPTSALPAPEPALR